jgi:hypothetical protein
MSAESTPETVLLKQAQTKHDRVIELLQGGGDKPAPNAPNRKPLRKSFAQKVPND